MKTIVILGDGMADRSCPSLHNKTLLQYANTPNMDRLAELGRSGELITVEEGFLPGSEVANMSVLGYDLPMVYEGRGVLEAASIGVDLKPGQMAMRCNLVSIDGEILKNHSAGHITTADADILIKYLEEKLGGNGVHLYTGVSYRHLLVVDNADKRIECVPPHDVPLQPWRPLLVKALVPEAQPTADLLNGLIFKSQELLSEHPLNIARAAAGRDMANSIWPWSPGYRPKMEPLSARFPQIKSGSVITAVDLIRGIGKYAGLQVIDVEGATGLYDTNYENKVKAALEALRCNDFVYLHIEASDEAGHEGDIDLKLRTIEDLDSRVVGPIMNQVMSWDEPVAIAVLPDHPTPCDIRTHTADAVPFVIYKPGVEPDTVTQYNEIAAKQGAYGVLRKDQFINELML